MNPIHLFDRFRKPDVLDVQSRGLNTTFAHREGCQKPLRPCGCMPTFQPKSSVTEYAGPKREFWVTPHANRAQRRRAARAAQGRVVSKASSKSRMHQS